MTKEEAHALLQEAFRLDARGREAEAIPLYKRALRLGLREEVKKHALIGLASSLRNVGRLPEARRVIERARRTYKGDPAIEAFFALILHDLGEGERALKALGQAYLAHVRDPRLFEYERPLARKFRALGQKKRR